MRNDRSTPVKAHHRRQILPSSPRRNGRRRQRGPRRLARLAAGAWPISTPSAASRGIPNLTPEQIAAEWTRQTISTDPDVVATVDKMLMQSWPATSDYTGPLGMQTLTDITGSHYGPNIEVQRAQRLGPVASRRRQGIGMDRTVATGTGFVGQYPPEVAKHLRVARHHARQSAALLPSRALHLQAALGQNRDPVHLRQPLRGRGRRRAVCALSGQRSKATSIPTLYRRRARAARIPGRPRHRVARRDRAVFPQAKRHSRCRRAAPATIPAASKPKTRASPATRSSTSRHGKMHPAAKPFRVRARQDNLPISRPRRPKTHL